MNTSIHEVVHVTYPAVLDRIRTEGAEAYVERELARLVQVAAEVGVDATALGVILTAQARVLEQTERKAA